VARGDSSSSMTDLTDLDDPTSQELVGEDNDDQRDARDTISLGHVDNNDLLATATWSELAACLGAELEPPKTWSRLDIIDGWVFECEEGKEGIGDVVTPDCEGSSRQNDRS